MLTSMASLGLVMGLLAGLLWWVRRRAGRTPASGRHIQVVETVPLGAGQFLHLVRLGERGLLVASSARRCELICELDAGSAENPEPAVSWAEVLRARWGRT